MHLMEHASLSEVAEICREHGVERLDIFGSAVRSDFDPSSSDLDFIVRFAPPHDRGYADRYMGFAEALEALFGRPVDLLTERSLRNPIFKQNIAADRRTLYGA
jgi:predicted nucleotidyltransferase